MRISAATIWDRFGPLLLVLLLLALGCPALSSYNVTWDEALGDLFYGERYLSFFTSLDPVYLDFSVNPYPADRGPDLSVSPFRNRPWEYYPVANVLAAATSSLLSRRSGLLDPFDGFHAVNLLLASLLLLVFVPWASRVAGRVAAALSACLLFLTPRVVCHLLANIKDFPEMVFFTLTLVAFAIAYEKGSAGGLLGAGVLWGLALGTKANAIFLPGIALITILVAETPEPWRGRRWKLTLVIIAAGIVGVLVLIACWPYLWQDPLGRLLQNLRYIAYRAQQTRPESLSPPLEALALTTPLPFLALFLVGVIPLLRRVLSRDLGGVLLLAWIGVVLGRLHLPNAVNFDGVRHFLEVFPAMALVTGLGGSWIVGQLKRLPLRRALYQTAATTIVVLPIAVSAVILLRVHPLEIAYWNPMVGGLAGARASGKAQAGDYWGTSYRLGLRWLNQQLPEGSLLAVPVVEHAVRLVAPVRLRSDIGLVALTTPVSPEIDPDRLGMLRAAARRQPVFVMFVHRRDWRNVLMQECEEHRSPIAEWRLQGAPVLSIYKY